MLKLWLSGILCLVLTALRAEDVPVDVSRRLPPPAAGAVDFVRDVKPILEEHCWRCHGAKKQQGDLRLDRKGQALEGGVSGPAITPGASAASRLIVYVAGVDDEIVMPPRGERLSAEQVGVLRAWIDRGASWPDEPGDEGWNAERDARRWAFRPPYRPPLPSVRNAGWARGAIDRFILARLERASLAPSAAADRRTLIRRLHLDLLGLPPSPEAVARFVDDTAPLAYERLVDRLLASPRYGERWGRHWLDTVRFAETNGFETNTPRKNAWPYRDYVIRAFNEDKPYTDFIVEQLAGDACGEEAATGFLVGGPYDQVKSPDPELTLQQRMDELHDMVSTTSAVFLGLTVGCARCHNHKFDPVTQKEYYALQAVFAGVQHGEREIRGPDRDGRLERLAAARRELEAVRRRLVLFEPLADPHARAREQAGESRLRSAVHPARNLDRFAPTEARFVRFTILETNSAEPCIDELEIYSAGGDNVALASAGATATSSSDLEGFEIHKLEHINDGRHGNGRSWISGEKGRGRVEIALAAPTRIDHVVWGRDREQKYTDRLATAYRIEVAAAPGAWRVVASSGDRRPGVAASLEEAAVAVDGVDQTKRAEFLELRRRGEELEKSIARLRTADKVYAGQFTQPGPTHRLHRGDAFLKREVVAPGSIAALGDAFVLSTESPERARRLTLARWLGAAGNSLTARVIVNRLWQYHFGAGLVRTPSDFGANGSRPSHPELLDWLAVELVSRGWRLKAIQRLIVLSSAYRQASRPRAAALGVDAGSRLLWRFPPRRLEAEPIRDSILQASGTLDLRMGGPGYEVFEPDNSYVHIYIPKRTFGPEEWRRMVYQYKPRMEQDETFGVFDCPDAAQMAPRRTRSTTPLQALNLLNSPFVLQQAELFAARLRREVGSEPRRLARRAFRVAFGREPAAEEERRAVEIIDKHGLPMLCRALFNANEFVYVH